MTGINPGAARRTRRRARRGVALLLVLGVLSALGIIAATVAAVCIADVRMMNNALCTVRAFYAADAGSQYIIGQIEHELGTGALVLTGQVVTVNYAAPADLTFDTVTQLEHCCDANAYLFAVTGRSGPAACRLEVVIRRLSAFQMGLFGDKGVDMKQNGAIYSYYSDMTPTPTAEDSTGDVVIGSNESMITHQDSIIDGSFVLGVDSGGTPGSWTETPSGGSQIMGEVGVSMDRVDPDPLGVVSGALAATFSAVAASNDNASASPPISAPQNRLRLKNGETAILTSGNYYLQEVDIKQGGVLVIDASSGPVNIYLSGSFLANQGSQINITGKPDDFVIYSNSDDNIVLRQDGDFKGIIYAPLATVEVKNSADYYGLLWAGELDLKNGGDIYMDLSAMDGFLSNRVAIYAWKEVRD